MAIIEIKGVVKKIFASSFTVAEKVQIPGYEFEKLYTVWSKEPPAIGSNVVVIGKVTMKAKSYGDDGDKKYYVDCSINDATVTIFNE